MKLRWDFIPKSYVIYGAVSGSTDGMTKGMRMAYMGMAFEYIHIVH